MSSILRSFSGASSSGGAQNDFVGKVFEIAGGKRIKIKKVLAEGGFSFVFLAQDITTSAYYAVKRLIVADKERMALARREVEIMKQLGKHENMIEFYDALNIPASSSASNADEVIIVMELCAGGMLVEIINSRPKRPFTKWQVLRIFAQACRAVELLHRQVPPIIHRDLKVENLLVNDRGVIKLCDFGSATTKIMKPNGYAEVSQAEEEIQLNTTLQYRAPEMNDLYSGKAVSVKADVWALGCILYKLCFFVTPFEDGSKLAIVNAKYTIPENSQFREFHDLIRIMLNPDPDQRPNVSDILQQVTLTYAELGPDPTRKARGGDRGLADLTDPDLVAGIQSMTAAARTEEPQQRQSSSAPVTRESSKESVDRKSSAPSRPQPPQPPQQSQQSQQSQQQQQQQQQASGSYWDDNGSKSSSSGGTTSKASTLGKQFLSKVKDVSEKVKVAGGELARNVKDKSSEVIRSVVAGNTIKESADLDLTYITPRIIAMSFPAEGVESTYRNNIDAVRNYLDTHHGGHYMVYNLSERNYNHAKFHDCVVDFGWPPHQAPPLERLFSVCQSMHSWLTVDRQNVAVVHCIAGKGQTGLVISAYLNYCGLFSTMEEALKLFASKRFKNWRGVTQPSQIRYVSYFNKLLAGNINPHDNAIVIQAIVFNTIPQFDVMRTSCRPFFEIYKENKLVFTTMPQNPESLKSVNVKEGRAAFHVGFECQGDILIIGYHAAFVLGVINITKMFRLQFHTGIVRTTNKLTFNKNELDDAVRDDRFYDAFSLTLEVQITEKVIQRPKNVPHAWELIPPKDQRLYKKTCFFHDEEANQLLQDFALSTRPFRDTPSDHQEDYDDGDDNGDDVVDQQHRDEMESQGYQTYTDEDGADNNNTNNNNNNNNNGNNNGRQDMDNSGLDWDENEEEPIAPPQPIGAQKFNLFDDNFAAPTSQSQQSQPQSQQPQFKPQQPQQQPQQQQPKSNDPFGLFGDTNPVPPRSQSPATTTPASSVFVASAANNRSSTSSPKPQSPSVGLDEFDLLSLSSSNNSTASASASAGKPPSSNGGSQNTSYNNLQQPLSQSRSSNNSSGDLLGFDSFGPAPTPTLVPNNANNNKPKDAFGDLMGGFNLTSQQPTNTNVPLRNMATSTSTVPPTSNSSSFSGLHSSMGGVGGVGGGYGATAPSTMGYGNPGMGGMGGMSGMSGMNGMGGMNSMGGMGYGNSGMGNMGGMGTMGYGNTNFKPNNQQPFIQQQQQQQYQQQPQQQQQRQQSPAPTPKSSDPFIDMFLDSASSKPNAPQQQQQQQQQQQPARPQQQQSVPVQTRPNYYASSASATQPSKPNTNNAASKGSSSGMDFSDLLGGFNPTSNKVPGTMNEMKKAAAKEEAKTPEDLERLRVQEWLEGGKKHNIRAILASLHTILWEDSGWKEVPMAQLLKPNEIKKAYMKACLIIHPDKVVGTPHENLANLLFCELSEAQAAFKADA